ncbi:hypothetical protein [Bartonella massiliensis]|uniref:hypothetical protein n=1 Tax=Bartonella massiliensis TaxID=929795 RepID=UPI00115B97CF|nr:hypothetical protein [Bartonella massiliensis]
MFKFVLCFLFLFSFASHAQEKKQEMDNPSLISSLVANYPLTEDLLLKLEKIEKECEKLPSELKKANTKRNPTTNNDHVEGYIAYISSKPGLVNILIKNNLTPKDFVISHLALKTTLNVLTNEEISLHEQNIVPLSNIEFAKEHMYRIIKILRSDC